MCHHHLHTTVLCIRAGLHEVADIHCKSCMQLCGWRYVNPLLLLPLALRTCTSPFGEVPPTDTDQWGGNVTPPWGDEGVALPYLRFV